MGERMNKKNAAAFVAITFQRKVKGLKEAQIQGDCGLPNVSKRA